MASDLESVHVETAESITEEVSDGSNEVLPEEAEEEQEPGWHSADWAWPCYDEVYDNMGNCERRRRAEKLEDEEKKDPFEVIYSNMKGMPWSERVAIEVNSEYLRTELQKVWPTKQRLRFNATYSIKGKELFYKLDRLKEIFDPNLVEAGADGTKSGERIGQVQLRHLIRFVETDFSKSAAEHERMSQTGRVSFDMLWTFMKPGENIVYKCDISGELICGKLRRATYQVCGSCTSLQLKLDVYDYNCESYSKYTNYVEIPAYENLKPLNKLEIYPYRFVEDSAKIEERLLAQGARFGYLATSAKHRYMQYRGTMLELKRNNYGQEFFVKRSADGRVMIDPFSYSKVSLDNSMGNADISSVVVRGGQVRTIDISQDPNRIYSPAFVFGFSFRLKKWGRFSVHGFSEAVFDDGSSWNQLVMDPSLKDITEHLVAQHLRKLDENEQAIGIDLIANKGDGCVIVCYGPPGTGKTLTAESLAEKLNAPLWSLSVSELGVSPGDLEDRLVSILEVASSWKTVLLLDEADVYLEKRADSDITRNAMCGIFLRHLEYYSGVLFLTTNRIITFDDAFRSRISVFLRYPSLTTEQREIIWTNLLRRAKLEEEASTFQELVKHLAVHKLNGREIRNAIQNAQTLAQAVKEPLSCEHVIDATKILVCSIAIIIENQS